MDISVVIPVYNEITRIRKSIIRLDAYLRKNFSSYEIIAVDDGSSDGTKEALAQAAKEVPSVCLLSYEKNRGKGFAVREGVLSAKGALVVFTDADLSTPPQEIGRFAKQMKGQNNLILIGSRNLSGSVIKIRQPFYRLVMGRVFNLAVRLITHLPFRDTQCGFKMFTRETGKQLFSGMSEDGYVFDVELLLCARKKGFEVEEQAIRWVNNAKSKISPIRNSISMFRDLLKVATLAK